MEIKFYLIICMIDVYKEPKRNDYAIFDSPLWVDPAFFIDKDQSSLQMVNSLSATIWRQKTVHE